MSSYSAEQILDKYRELHERINGQDRACGIAIVRRSSADPFTPDRNNLDVTVGEIPDFDPHAIVVDTPDAAMQQAIGGGAIGLDEKIFVLHSESLVDREPVATISERAEAYLRDVVKPGNGIILYGTDYFTPSRFHAGKILIGIVTQWYVIAKLKH